MTSEKQMPEENERFFASAQNDTQENEQQETEDWAELDRELAQMAQDTPEMPDDFHARWTEQVRAEAGQARQKARMEKRRQWRYILSAAAVFVFLIGGTLLTRSQKTNDLTANNAVIPRETAGPEVFPAEEQAAGMAAEDAGAAGMADMAWENSETAEQETGAAPEAEWFASLFRKEESSSAQDGGAAYAVNAAPAYGAMEAAPEEAMEEAEAAAPAAAKSAEKSAKAANSAVLPAATAKPTASPTPEQTAELTQEPMPEPTYEPAAEDSPFVSFLKDLGVFTLKTLGVCILPAAAAVLVLRKRRKK